MLKKILVIVIVLIAGVLIFAATRPDTFRVERTVGIKAPPEKVFPLINDLRAQAQWSPWEKRDPAMKKKLSGAETGKGAVYEWDGNSDVGKGRIEIIDVVAPTKVTLKLDMIEPMEAQNTVEFTLAAQGRRDRRDLGHARTATLHRQARRGLHRLRQDGRRRFRDRACQSQGDGGKIS